MSRKNDPSLLDDAHELFKLTPIWVGPLAALTAFLLIRYLAPQLIPKPAPGVFDPHDLYRSLLHIAAWFVAAILLLAWIAAELWKIKNRRLFTTHRDIHSIRSLTWRDFSYSFICVHPSSSVAIFFSKSLFSVPPLARSPFLAVPITPSPA